MTKFDVENPSTGEVIKTYAFTEEAEIHHKIERAYEAYLSWREVDAHERSRLL
ncbi:aldehyde dehydrogenase family protein, partial [Staphylococcus pseudintermedius]|nr:aldehyde dehydrogenase family protein [Staphylococcus pseudintermedius]